MPAGVTPSNLNRISGHPERRLFGMSYPDPNAGKMRGDPGYDYANEISYTGDWQLHLGTLVRDHGVRLLVDRRGNEHVPLPAHCVDVTGITNKLVRIMFYDPQGDHETPESVLDLFQGGVLTIDRNSSVASFFCQPSDRGGWQETNWTVNWWDGIVRHQPSDEGREELPPDRYYWNALWEPDETNALPVALVNATNSKPLLVQITPAA